MLEGDMFIVYLQCYGHNTLLSALKKIVLHTPSGIFTPRIRFVSS